MERVYTVIVLLFGGQTKTQRVANSKRLISTIWSHSPYCKTIAQSDKTAVSRALDFFTWWHPLTSEIARYLPPHEIFSLGYLKAEV
ncbi:hypothetical protein PR048_016587 [Dryococelus australis]|uniref:Uncharacterized protein n=1 Tax=Dryococelus australis TaxID=614101 RepID=A0ABQ9H782_9NEOP|nr:hypothetical protein PR048_016587 [Dryococelus australis]